MVGSDEFYVGAVFLFCLFYFISEKVMSHISDSLWKIIRSNDDGMKGEIMETVQSVYDKLANPKGKDEVMLSTSDAMPGQRQGETASGIENDDCLHENEPQEPPGFTLLHNHLNNNNHEDQGSTLEQKKDAHSSPDTLGEDDHCNVPPGFSKDTEHNPPPDCTSDEDPDVPPGFG